MTQFVKVGRIVKDRRALKIEIDGREACGEQVIGSAAVSELLSGRRVDVSFVQTPTPDRVFIGWSGEAWVSRSGKAITLRIGATTYTSPINQVRAVAAGTRAAAILSRPTPDPVIDADGRQARPIDEGLRTEAF
ncbi:MAG: hypothetical protein GX885_11375 [Methanomicrobiales archaeon]|nr:hypothetical protein [Methanomicrobiales archaeon]